MDKNDSALRALIEALDAELERRSLIDGQQLLASGSGMHWLAERASRHGLNADEVIGLVL